MHDRIKTIHKIRVWGNLSYEDAADVFSNCCETWIRRGEEPPDQENQGLTLFKMRQVMNDYLRSRNRVKRGGGAAHLQITGIDDFLVSGDPSFQCDQVYDDGGSLSLLDLAENRTTPKGRILIGALRRIIASGDPHELLADELTAAERSRFMGIEVNGEGWSEEAYRKEVSRRKSELFRLLRGLHRDSSGFGEQFVA